MQEWLFSETYKFIFIFLRMGTALMFMPGYSSSYVNMRFRLSIALVLSAILVPFLEKFIPAPPDTLTENIRIFFIEIGYGAFLGILMQLMYYAINICGNFAGQSSGFANAQIFDPTSQNQSIVSETFLSVIAITVIFMTDLHHLMLSAAIDSYTIWPAGEEILLSDMSNFLSSVLNKSFIIGFKIGAPFIAFTIIFYTGMGLLSRLMPQLNIFFLSLPLQIYLGLGLLLITCPAMIMWFTKYYEDGLMQFIR